MLVAACQISDVADFKISRGFNVDQIEQINPLSYRFRLGSAPHPDKLYVSTGLVDGQSPSLRLLVIDEHVWIEATFRSETGSGSVMYSIFATP